MIVLPFLGFVSACSGDQEAQAQKSTGFQETDYFYPVPAPDDVALQVGQIVYVPVYSHVYLSGLGTRDLAITVSIRNTDPDDPIIIQSVRYYDTGGRLLENFVPDSHFLGPLATTEVVIDQKDTRGGSGANFIVEWGAERSVNQPIVEAVMVGITGTQGLSFSSSGQVVAEKYTAR